MALTSFGIVYATESKMIRRIILPDDDSELASHRLADGESMLATPIGPSDLFTCQDLVLAATGVQPADPRCAVVDADGTVVQIIAADPALDAHPDGELVACSSTAVDVGSTLDRATGEFTSPEPAVAIRAR